MIANKKPISENTGNHETKIEEFMKEFKKLSLEEMLDVLAMLKERKRYLESESTAFATSRN